MTTADVNIDQEQPSAQQDKDARRSYRFDLSHLIAPGDSIASCTWAPVTGLTINNSSVSGAACSVTLSGGTAGTWYAVVGAWVSAAGDRDQIILRLFIKSDAEALSGLGSALFPNRFTAVKRLRSERLLVAAKSLPGIEFSDDYLWDKLRAAEAETARELSVFLSPTTLFPATPTDDEITALNGAPWAEDPGYDYGPDFFAGDRWGFVRTRNKPLISVASIKLTYPAPAAVTFDFPIEWLRFDKRAGVIQLVPSSNLTIAAQGGAILQFIFNRQIPFSLHIKYVAGLENVSRDWPDILDLVLKRATLNVVHDSFRPQSGSISADGLSQSISMDVGKYEEKIDLMINGPKGSNGGLMRAIHGMRLGVM